MSTNGTAPEVTLLAEIRDLLQPEISEHQHRYTVPVEWNTLPAHFELTNPKNGAGVNLPDQTVVTKLRCDNCPSEVERKAN